MRKIIICFFVLLFTSFTFAQNSGSVELDLAISNSVRDIRSTLPAASVVAVYNFDSPSDSLSKYIANQMIQNISNNTSLRVVERDSQNISLIDQRIEYSTSGNVSNNSIHQEAKKLGAKFTIYGSFEQYGSLLQLTVRATNVETGEIPVVCFYFIQKTKKLETLLGTSLVMESSSDYMNAIASCISKMENINADYNSETNNVKSKISSEYQVKINEAKSIEKDAWLSQAEHQANINKEVNKIEKERDTKISGEIESISIKYSELRNNVENEIATLKRKLEVETFILRNDDVKILFGEFNPEASPKHWKYSIESKNRNINYKYEGIYSPLATDLATEYKSVEDARTTTGFVGEIAYQVVSNNDKNSFDIKILNVKVLYPDGSVLKTENINKVIGQVSAVNKNIVTQKNTTKQTVVRTETTSVNTKSNKEKTATNDARLNDIFGIGLCTLDGTGIYANALSSTWNHFFINWLNFIYTEGSLLLGMDCGFTFRLWRLYPFIKGGLYYGYIDGCSQSLFVKLGVGTDLKLNNYFKLFTNLDCYFGGIAFNVGLSVGKPAKK